MNIGVISDTHNLMRPEALRALAQSDLIIHAGDVGSPQILERLKEVAPTIAVRGNMDKDQWAKALPFDEACDVGGRTVYVLHCLDVLDLDPVGRFDAVIFGHSHVPSNTVRKGVLYFNPGSAGPRRFSLPVTVGRITVTPNGLSGEIVHLEV